MIAAIGSVQRTHPFTCVFIFHRRDALKISASDRVELNRRLEGADLRNRRGKVRHGIVLERDGGVTCGSLGNHVNIDGDFFAGLDADVLNLAKMSFKFPPLRHVFVQRANPQAILSQCFSTANFMPY